MPDKIATLPAFILTSRNNTASLDKSFYSICRNGPSGILAWITWADYQNVLAQELNAFEVCNTYVMIKKK